MPPTKTRARAELVNQLGALQEQVKRDWLDRSLPEDWNALDHWHPIRPHRTRVTIRLDTDMVRWFRKLGPNYGARINAVVRVYWTALMAGEIHSHFGDDTLPQITVHANEMLRQQDRQNQQSVGAAPARDIA